MNRPTFRIRARSLLSGALVLLVISIALGAVAASPLAMRELSGTNGFWTRLSLIGQTYGAPSAVLAALALIGVAASIVLQVREGRASREQAVRALHFAVMDKAMADPLYAEVWDPISGTGDFDRHRQHMYVNQIVSSWQMEYELGTLSDRHLRTIAAEVLSGAAGHRYWTSARRFRIAGASTRRARRFVTILDEEYRRAPAPSEPPARTAPATRRTLVIAVGSIVTTGLLVRLIRLVRGRTAP